MDDAPLQGCGGRLGTVVDAQFIQHVPDVKFDRDLGDDYIVSGKRKK